jgi:hypothetical protein
MKSRDILIVVIVLAVVAAALWIYHVESSLKQMKIVAANLNSVILLLNYNIGIGKIQNQAQPQVPASPPSEKPAADKTPKK